MKTLKITFILFLISTIAFSQPKEGMMLSDIIKQVMLIKLDVNYDLRKKNRDEKAKTDSTKTISLEDIVTTAIDHFPVKSVFGVTIKLDGRYVLLGSGILEKIEYGRRIHDISTFKTLNRKYGKLVETGTIHITTKK